MLLSVKLLLSHLLGDFVLQPETWVKDKNRKKIKSKYLYVHLAIHGALVQLLGQDWIITVIIVVTHAVIDILKIYLQPDNKQRKWFLYDQFLHLAVIAAIIICYKGYDINLIITWASDKLLIITAIIFLTTPSSVLIKNIISRWDPDPDSSSSASLEKAGAYIGVLERLFVFTFVLNGHWDAVGFLIAAKSVFRFGDLKESQDRKLTEYILIGTFMSVGLASIIGALVSYLRI